MRAPAPAPHGENGSGPSAAATSAKATSCAVTVLVAGTARSSPAPEFQHRVGGQASSLDGVVGDRQPAPPAFAQPPQRGHDLRRGPGLADRYHQLAAVVGLDPVQRVQTGRGHGDRQPVAVSSR